MTRKEYLLKIENLIINKLKYHAPNVTSSDIDFSILEAIGIDSTLPIFIYKKSLNKLFFQAFLNVKKKINFNLILTSKPEITERKLKLLNQE